MTYRHRSQTVTEVAVADTFVDQISNNIFCFAIIYIDAHPNYSAKLNQNCTHMYAIYHALDEKSIELSII